MKLDFTFAIKSWVSEDTIQASDPLLIVLQNSDVKEEVFLDKIDRWGKKLKKDGAIEVDVPDAKFLKGLVIASELNALGKIALKEFINRRVTESEKL